MTALRCDAAANDDDDDDDTLAFMSRDAGVASCRAMAPV